MPNPYPSETDPAGWPLFDAGCEERYERYGESYPSGPQSLNWRTRAAYDIAAGMTQQASFEKHWRELDEALAAAHPQPQPPTPEPPQPPTGGAMPPMVGYGRTHGTCLGDDTGPRKMLFATLLPAVRLFEEYRDEFERQTDALIGRVLGIRICFFLVGDPWDGTSSPHKNRRDLRVDVRRQGFDGYFTGCLRRLQDKGLRAFVTSGAIKEMPDPEGTYQHIAMLCRSVNQQTVAGFMVLNEPWMVNDGGYEDWARWQRYSGIVQGVYPWNFHGTAAPASQEATRDSNGQKAGLCFSAQSPANVALLQGTRVTAADAIRRAFNVKHEGYRDFQRPIIDEEMTGPNLSGGEGAVYQPMNNPDDIFGLYTMKIFTGQCAVYLNGPGLWEQGPIDATWGVKELSALWREMGIPEAVGNWETHNLNTGLVTGDGFARIDGVSDGVTDWRIASGGSNGRVVARVDGQMRAWRSGGLLVDRHVKAGETFFAEGGPGKTIAVQLVRS